MTPHATPPPAAQRPRRLSATALIELTADPGSYISWDAAPRQPDLGAEYRAELAAAAEKSGVDESIITGEALLDGRRVALIASEFTFLAGSVGVAAAERLVLAMERATAERLPVLAAVASGGTRMQEGTVAFVAMVKIAASVAAHEAAGLPYLTYLRHPSTGGALASFGSLGQVTVAEPGALVGFLGPRVYEALYDAQFPAGVQSAENLAHHGIIDGVLPPGELREVISRTLRLLERPTHAELVARAADPGTAAADPAGSVDTWDSVVRTRDRARPGLRDLLRHAATDVVPLSGTGQGERDPGLALCLARFGGVPSVVVGQDRRTQRSHAPLGPGALRAARRAMHLAEELRLPLVSVIDTPGAALSRAAEEGGLASEIAHSLADLVTHASPTLSVLLGEGTGGGALALLPADRTLAAEHAWLSPLPPEGASAIVYRDTAHAPQLAEQQGVASARLRAHGIVDRIVAELPDAASEAEAFSVRMGDAIAQELAALSLQPAERRRVMRLERYRTLGA
ncbi:carboxyl transferase domain-containing protein [Leucobacter luti]|uniref:Acetyl-CoA carboxylase carboxyl transferase subunit beta n=1 Tax=Leucobacter luti TaxID=340320 RepID=A0A4Q7TSR4_9MICO|nr:carboxyl transferase domain-containing protein [Leucobacter luti]MBL3699924.1 acetyl-CoA carboxyl transferase [Leucobacter luti]RZT62758.1 acetyl-CoA carboxylase carboxyl transferase subunit beta [Leucobacter luti]